MSATPIMLANHYKGRNAPATPATSSTCVFRVYCRTLAKGRLAFRKGQARKGENRSVTTAISQRRQVTYSGNVQGVGFRYTARSLARGYEVVGFVRNLPDRRVEMVVEGPDDELDRFLAELAEQMSGRIRSVDCDRRPALGEFAEFAIRY